MIRLGLCCLFLEYPIRFRTTTATYLMRCNDRWHHLAQIASDNVKSLREAIEICPQLGVGAFRINSRLFPVASHPDLGYELEQLPNWKALATGLESCKQRAKELDIRLSFHPDQYTILNSPRPEVVEKGLQDLEIHAKWAELVGADVINIHAGGVYGDPIGALRRLEVNLNRLSPKARERLSLENDDRCYTPAQLLPFCQKQGVPFCYDVHHHRCLPDDLSIEEATALALATWPREPLFHLSSPMEGWQGPNPKRHHDLIDPNDWPPCWNTLDLTVDIEAKAKEQAVQRLRQTLTEKGVALSH